jgi:hypothetical protein
MWVTGLGGDELQAFVALPGVTLDFDVSAIRCDDAGS